MTINVHGAWRRRVIGALIVSFLIGACSQQATPWDDTGIDPDNTGATGTGGKPGSNGNGTSRPGLGGSVINPNSSTGGAGGDGSCAKTQVKAEPLPVDMYIMQDKSGSMKDNGKWDAVKQALSGFVTTPGLDGLGVGLGFFSKPGDPSACNSCTDMECMTKCGCTSISCTNGKCTCQAMGDSCSENDYAKPNVEISPLPGVAQAVVDAYRATNPDGSTPSLPALTGAIHHAKDWSASKKHRTVVVFATDGVPAGCDVATNTVQGCASAAAAGMKDGILTFVIGVGGDLTSLDAVAAAGGTNKAYIVDANGGSTTTQQFIDALKKIKTFSALACTYTVPQPQNGDILDPDKVNVDYTSGTPPTTVTIPRVQDKSACGPTPAWYYDDPKNPTQIIMCDSACKELSTTTDVGSRKLDMVLGCKTVVQPPPR